MGKLFYLYIVLIEITMYSAADASKVVCDFEKDMCVFKSVAINSTILKSGRAKYSDITPYNDHTRRNASGHYVFIRAPKRQPLGGFGNLTSSKALSGKCLSFWYFVYGSNVNYFIMKIKFQSGNIENSVLNVTTRNNWIKHFLELNNISTFKIILEVGFGSGNQSVAIDDIYLSNSSCSGNDTAADFLTNSKTTGKDETGIIVGVVCGVGFIIGLVFVLWYWRRRSKQRTKSNGQDMFINDLNGNQTVALPPEHESRKTEVLFKNINARNQVPSDINYDLAHSFGEDVMDNYIKPSSPPINDYDILDPNETGFNRSQFKAERQTEYEMAVSINHVENEPDLQDPYAVNENGTYDTSNNKLHKEEDTKLYSHTVDSVYDTTLHDVNRRQMDDDDGTYNHVFCEKTEDDYDVTKRE